MNKTSQYGSKSDINQRKLDNKDNGQVWKDNRIVYIKERIYVSNNRKIQEQVLQKNHDSVDIGHLGQQRMSELIKRNY